MLPWFPLCLSLLSGLVCASLASAHPLEIFEAQGVVVVNEQALRGPGILAAGSRITAAPGGGVLLGVRPSMRVLISGLADPPTAAAVQVVSAPDPEAGTPLTLSLISGEIALALDSSSGAPPGLAVDLGGVAFRFEAGSGFVERSTARTAIGIREGPARRSGQAGAAALPLPAGKTIVWAAGKNAAVTEFTPARSPHLAWLDRSHRLPLAPMPGTPWCKVLATWHTSTPGRFFESWARVLWSIAIMGAVFLTIAAPPSQPAFLGAALLLMEARWDFCHIWWVGRFIHLPVGAFLFGGLMILWIWKARGPWPDGRPPADQLAYDFGWRMALCLIPTALPLASADTLPDVCGKWGGFLAETRVGLRLPADFDLVPAEQLTAQVLPLEIFALLFLPVLLTAITRPKQTGHECRFCGRGRSMREVDRPLWRNQVEPLRASLSVARLEDILSPILRVAPLPQGQSSPYVLSVTYQLCSSCTIGELQMKLIIGTEPPLERSVLVRGRTQFDQVRQL